MTYQQRSNVYVMRPFERLRAIFGRGTWIAFTYCWRFSKRRTISVASGAIDPEGRYSCPAGHKGLKIVGFPEPKQGRGSDGTLYERVIYDLECIPCNLIFRMTSAWIEVMEIT